MTDATVLFARPAEPTGTPPGPTGDEGGPDRRRYVLLALIGAAVVLVAGAGYFLMFRHSSPPARTALTPHATAPTVPGARPASAGGSGTHHHTAATLPRPYSGQLGRDPFSPLYVAPAVSSAPSTAPSTGGGGTPAPRPSSPPAVATPVWVELDSYGATWATFRVAYSNNLTYVWQDVRIPSSADPKPSVFAHDFELLSLRNGVATVVMGDGAPFQLRQGFANRHPL
jgi:hypothetical protein